MRKPLFWILNLCFTVTSFAQERQAPAYPLVTHDPYFSIWSFSDQVNETPTTHWTGTRQDLIAIVQVDGVSYRILGDQIKDYRAVLSTAEAQPYRASITEEQPAAGWENLDFDDSQWRTASAPYGNRQESGTSWESEHLWLRRSFDLEELDFGKLYLKMFHDDNVEVYLNGQELYKKEGWTDQYEYFEIPEAVKEILREKDNLLAIHVKNTAGGQWLDAGLVELLESENDIRVAEQTSLDLTSTRTSYTFKCGGVDVGLSFTSPLLLDDLELLSRPVSYVSITAEPNDGEAHEVQVYFGASSAIATNEPAQAVVAEEASTDHLEYLKVGTVEQPVLEKKGDNLRIDWGYLYVATPKVYQAKQSITSATNAVSTITENTQESLQSGKSLMLNTLFPEERISSVKEYLVLLGYDDLYSLNYFGDHLRPWWNKEGESSLEKELEEAYSSREDVMKRVKQFDQQVFQQAQQAGGEKYAELLEMAYRQSIAAHKLSQSPQGDILFMSKENFSNGSINTVDVTYPSAPLYLLYNPDLLKGMLNGIFYYSESGKWKKPFPAHDLGTYPVATGQTYPEDMPVEESGNMIILSAAIAKAEGHAKYAEKHWESLTSWAEYLAEKGLDPANQLSTDDFSGHLARNANLSVKAIVALGSYAYLAEQLGKQEVSNKYYELSRNMARKWMELADAGDHYALTFNDKNTWSQKYNLVWDKVLGLDIFPKEVYEKELDFYRTKFNEYGLPLDNRSDYTKSDWIIWTATLADSKEAFQDFANPVYRFATESPDRVPLSDWHYTTSGEVVGFQARSVVGGYFMKLLSEQWK